MSSTAQPAADDPKSRDKKNEDDITAAQTALRGAELSPKKTFELAKRLKNANQFGYARKLFAQIRARGDYSELQPAKVGQQHALCTYKDPDVPASDRFKRALEILDEVDLCMNPNDTAARQESFGLRGAVHKRRWQIEGSRADLELSFGYYHHGYELGPKNDYGYTGINAAFVLDLLARENGREIVKTGSKWTVVSEQWQQAQDIRRDLVQLLTSMKTNEKNWWISATLAEAHFGLAEYDEALKTLLEYGSVNPDHPEAPLAGLSAWEFESTLTQLASLAQLQADLVGLLEKLPKWQNRCPFPSTDLRSRAEHTLREYLGRLAPGVERAFKGKIGVALSGGGFRASLFHLGVLAYLAERDVLRRVEALSCVSGGSIIGAHYYLEVQRLLESKNDADIGPQDYVELVERVQRDFLAGVQTNIRCRVFGSFWHNLRAFFQPGYTPTRRLGELYESQLYSRVQDKGRNAPRYLRDLFVKPPDEGPEFKPKYDNWRRGAKIPTLVLNATTMNTGHNWQFTASWMGEPPSSLDAEIEGNYRLRRMYHSEAPRLRDKWNSPLLRPFAPPDYQHFRLGEAVASSSAVPGLFEPLVLTDLYDGKTVRLSDGGVYDNQGTASLLEQDCTFMIVSDASGQMEAEDSPSGGRLGVPLRSFSISMARVRQSEYQELSSRLRSGLLKGLVFLHLKKDLDADPIDWRECQDPHDASDEARPASQRGVLTHYGMQKGVQRMLSAIRTDLDSFTEVEAFSLMTSGYKMAQGSSDALADFPNVDPPAKGWRFLEVERLLKPGPGFDEITKQLKVGQKNAGKVWFLKKQLSVVAGVIAALAFYGAVRLWPYVQDRVVTVQQFILFAFMLAAPVLVTSAVRIVRYRQSIRDLGLRFLLAAALAVVFKFHLMLFDPIFLNLGRIGNFDKIRPKPKE